MAAVRIRPPRDIRCRAFREHLLDRVNQRHFLAPMAIELERKKHSTNGPRPKPVASQKWDDRNAKHNAKPTSVKPAAKPNRKRAEKERAESLARENASRSPTVTRAGRAVAPPPAPLPTAPQPGKRPPAHATMDEVREKVNAQIRKALPAIAAAVKENGDRSG